MVCTDAPIVYSIRTQARYSPCLYVLGLLAHLLECASGKVLKGTVNALVEHAQLLDQFGHHLPQHWSQGIV